MVNLMEIVCRNAQLVKARQDAVKAAEMTGKCPTCGRHKSKLSKAKLMANRRWWRKMKASERSALAQVYVDGGGI